MEKIEKRVFDDKIKRQLIPLDYKIELERLGDEVDAITDEDSDEQVIYLHRKWLDFMKETQAHFRFSDQDIAEMEKVLKIFVQRCEDEKVAIENTKQAEIKLQKSMAALDDAMVKEYERTGKMPVLPFRSKKIHKGN